MKTLLILLIALCFTVESAVAQTHRLEGRVAVPAGVDPHGIEIYLHDGVYTEIENTIHGVRANTRIDQAGLFAVSTTSDTINLSIEFTGPGVRRARFPWPEISGSRAVFRLNRGSTTLLQVTNRETGEPLPHPLVGPIFPSEDAEHEAVDRSFPFFVRGDETGRVEISGLIENTTYAYPIYVPGFMRQRSIVPSGATSQVTLDAGGVTVEGQLLGSRTQQPWPNEVVRVYTSSNELVVLQKTNSEARFRVEGLPPGEWFFAPVIESLGDMRPSELTLAGTRTIRGFVVEVNEGIELALTLSDIESGLPIAGATILARSRLAQTDRLGRAAFERLTGPWPLRLEVDVPGYEFLDEDQRDDRHPVNGYDSSDLTDLALFARKLRYLDVQVATSPEAEEFQPAVLELFETIDQRVERPVVHRVEAPQSVYRLGSAGNRAALLRRFDGTASDLLGVYTDLADTTTTITPELSLGATLAGYLVYEEGGQAPAFRLILRAQLNGEFFDFSENRPSADGDFAVDGLPPGNFLARFIRADNSLMLEEPVTLERGAVTPLEKTISRGQILAGRVVSPEGAPQAEIPLQLYGYDPQGNSHQRLVMSGEDGTFRIEGFARDRIKEIQIDHHQWKPMSIRDVPIPQDGYEIRLEEPSGFRVTAVASAGALRVARAIVLYGATRSDALASGQWYFIPGEQESFGGGESVFLSPRSSGYIQIAVEADGLWDVSAPIQWTPDTRTRNLSLTPAHRSTLTLKLPGASANDLGRSIVSLVNTSLPEDRVNTAFTPTVRPPDTLFFERLPAGQYLLLITSERGDTITRTNLYIGGGENRSLVVEMTPSLFSVSGRLLDSGATRGVADATVRLYYGDMAEPPPLDEVRTGRDGRFEFRAVPGARPLFVEALRGDVKARRMIEPLTTDLFGIDFSFPTAVRVRFELPPQLAQRSARASNVPFIITSATGGEGISLTGEEISGAHTLWAGDYIAFWGEDLLGAITVTERGGTITLPEIRSRP